MRVYKCDMCDCIMDDTMKVRVQHWFTKRDICYKCWREFKNIMKNKEKKND